MLVRQVSHLQQVSFILSEILEKRLKKTTCTCTSSSPKIQFREKQVLWIWDENVCCHECMVVGFTSTYEISTYHHWCCEFKSRSGWSVQHYVIRCQWLATGQWFSLRTSVSSTNKIDRHDITEILLKVALNTIKQLNKHTAS